VALVRTPVEIERKRRINLALWAFAYEMKSTSLVSDAKFDSEAKLVDLSISTDNSVMDTFFKTHFQNFTGQWIHKHPQLDRIEKIYDLVTGGKDEGD